MVGRRLWLIGWVCGIGGVGGCEPSAAGAPYWQVEWAGRTNHVLGTLHAGVEYDQLPERVHRDLSAARILITEADVRSIDAMAFHQAITLPAGQSLRDHLDSDEWLRLTAAFAGSYPPPSLETTQPWFLHGLLVQILLPTDSPIDTTLVERAAGQSIDLGFLETWQAQATLLTSLGVEDGLVGLLPAVADLDETQRELRDWVQAYQQVDLEALAELSLAPEDLASRPQYFGEVVFGRNFQWLDPLEPELRAGNAFLAVGVQHLLSDNGLPSLWRAQGYTVTLVR